MVLNQYHRIDLKLWGIDLELHQNDKKIHYLDHIIYKKTRLVEYCWTITLNKNLNIVIDLFYAINYIILSNKIIKNL